MCWTRISWGSRARRSSCSVRAGTWFLAPVRRSRLPATKIARPLTVPASRIVIGLAGGTGSGKTTVAHGILERVGPERIAYVPHDAYYRSLAELPPAQRDGINWDHPDALDTDLMIEQVQALKSGQAIEL